MMTRRRGSQARLCLVDWDELIPADHLLRRIEELVDFRFIYDMVKHLYSDGGRPSIDPVLLFKMTLIGYLYGIPSERRLEQEVRLNLAYRWFLGLEVDDSVPDHSVFSQNRRRRFGDAGVFQQIFDHLVRLCVDKGLVTGELVVTDSTPIKANAAMGKNEVSIEVSQTPSEYLKALNAEADRLDAELDQGRARRSRRKPQGSRPPGRRDIKISRVDPDARRMNRPGHPGGYYYLNHQTIDTKNGIIVDVHITPGNVNDHEPYGDRLEQLQRLLGMPIQQAAADRGYDGLSVHRKLGELGIKGFIPRQIRRGPAKTFRKDQFEYVAAEDAYRCPAGKWLRFRHISRQLNQKVYSTRAADCKDCPLRTQCLARTARVKQITRPFFQDAADVTHSRIGTDAYQWAQRLRRIWCEGTFGLQKRLHTLGRARMRGLNRVHEQGLMAAIAVNLKRMVKVLPAT